MDGLSVTEVVVQQTSYLIVSLSYLDDLSVTEVVAQQTSYLIVSLSYLDDLSVTEVVAQQAVDALHRGQQLGATVHGGKGSEEFAWHQVGIR